MEYLTFRSLMFVPGHNEKLMKSAERSEADVLLLDIEDSVQPINNKQVARDTIKEFVEEGFFKNHLVFPRVNDRESGQLLKDVHQLTIKGVHGFMYPKSTKAEDIYFFDKLLETIEYEKNIPIGTFKIIALIETTAAALNAQSIAEASPRVVALAFGCEDFITDLEGIHDKEGLSIFSPRAIIAMAARAAGVIPVDTVHINIHDLEDLEKNLQLALKLGYEGMLVLHPKEIPLVHKYFTPSEGKYNEAVEMLRLAEKAKKDGKGVAIMNNKFIGPPMIKTAEKTIKKYREVMRRKNK